MIASFEESTMAAISATTDSVRLRSVMSRDLAEIPMTVPSKSRIGDTAIVTSSRRPSLWRCFVSKS